MHGIESLENCSAITFQNFKSSYRLNGLNELLPILFDLHSMNQSILYLQKYTPLLVIISI